MGNNADERWLSRPRTCRPLRAADEDARAVGFERNRPALRTDGSTRPIPPQRRNRLGNSAVRRQPRVTPSRSDALTNHTFEQVAESRRPATHGIGSARSGR